MENVKQDLPTRVKLILAAERLLGERGFQHVSVKEILAAAGQRNESALQYHFGSRAGLISAVFAYRVDQIEARRIELLNVLEAEGRSGDLRGVLGAALGPLVEVMDSEDKYYLLFAVQALFDPKFDLPSFIEAPSMDGLGRAVSWIRAAVPDLPDHVFGMRLRLAIEMSIGAMARWIRAETAPDSHAQELFVSNLLDTAEAVLRAPLSEETARIIKQTAS